MARFEKGMSGNPCGRPKGSKNKASADIKAFIEELLNDEGNKAHLKTQFKKARGLSAIKAFAELVPYILPKLSSNHHEFENLTDQQLDEVIESLKRSALGEQEG